MLEYPPSYIEGGFFQPFMCCGFFLKITRLMTEVGFFCFVLFFKELIRLFNKELSVNLFSRLLVIQCQGFS